MKYKRIHIVGIYGAGKSTLARVLGKITGYPVYELDDIKYKRKYDIKRAISERRKIIKEISKKKKWVTEGTWIDYAKELYEKADIVIFLLSSKKTLKKRILIRYIKRKFKGQKYFSDGMKNTLHFIKKINQYFDDPNSFITLKSHLDYIKKHSKNFVTLRNNQEIKKFLSKLR